MHNHTKLTIIKAFHTAIWVLFVGLIGYVLWCGISGNITVYSWIAVAAVIIEGLVLMMFNGYYPLTIVAKKYTSNRKSNFDIYLPNWLARYNKHIFTTIFIIGLVLMLVQLF